MFSSIWVINEQNRVKLDLSAFGHQSVFLNDQLVYKKLVLLTKNLIDVNLNDGRQAQIKMRSTGYSQEAELRVDGALILSEREAATLACLKCEAKVKRSDKFCEKCGIELPTPEAHVNVGKVKAARGAILTVAAFFAISGVAMFFIQKNAATKSLQNLSQMKSEEIYPTEIGGRKYTVGELRLKVEFEPWSILAVNLILSAIMLGLGAVAKKAPLPATLIAAAVYIVVQVANGIVSPPSIAQGMIMKIFLLGILFRGVRAGLELRKARVYA